MFEVRPFHPDDVLGFDPHEVYYGSLDVLKSQATIIYESKSCFTASLYLDGQVNGIVGVSVMWPGNADCWTLLSKQICKHPLNLQRTMIDLIEDVEKTLKLRRLSAGTDVRFKQGGRWLRSLGFHLEGTMRKYGPDGSDWNLYARTK